MVPLLAAASTSWAAARSSEIEPDEVRALKCDPRRPLASIDPELASADAAPPMSRRRIPPELVLAATAPVTRDTFTEPESARAVTSPEAPLIRRPPDDVVTDAVAIPRRSTPPDP